MVEMRVRVALLAAALLTWTPTVGRAAQFDLVSDQSSTNITPADLDAPCATLASAAADASDGGGDANFEATVEADASGDSPSCNQTAKGTATAHGLFKLIPNGENPGDPVPVCIQVLLERRVAAIGDATATVDQDLVAVDVISGGGTRPLVRIPASSITAGDQQELTEEFRCDRDATMAVGDQLDGRLGGSAIADLFGIGEAAADGSFQMRVEVGTCIGDFQECPLNIPAPAVSTWPLAALAALLLLSGLGVQARRKAV